MGAVTDVVKRNVPASYRALISASSAVTYDYGITELQAIADFVQYRIFSTVPGASNESTVYNYKEVELAGMLTTLQFIPAAIDYWGDQIQSESATGTREQVTYLDRRKELWNVFESLTKEAQKLADELEISTGGLRSTVPKVSYGDNDRGILVTNDPELFPAAYSEAEDPIVWVSE